MAVSIRELENLQRLTDVARRLDSLDPEDASDVRSELLELAEELRSYVFEEQTGRAVEKRTAARFLGISEDTLARWLDRGVLRRARIATSPKEFLESDSVLDAHLELSRLRREGARARFFERLAGANVRRRKSHAKDTAVDLTSEVIGLRVSRE